MRRLYMTPRWIGTFVCFLALLVAMPAAALTLEEVQAAVKAKGANWTPGERGR